MQKQEIDSSPEAPEAFTGIPKAKSRIVIIEDHTIMRDALRSLLSSRGKFEVIGEAEDGIQGIKCVARLNPDLVIIDLLMPRMNGHGVILEIKRHSPQIKILALTIHDTEEYIRETFQAGVDGYCLKDATHAELIMAIECIQSGKKYISPSITDKLVRVYVEGKREREGRDHHSTTTV